MSSDNGTDVALSVVPYTRTTYLAQTGLIAAVYATCTFVVMQLMGYFSWGPIQLRISEALTVLPLFFPAAIPGLTLGCFISNLLNLGMTGPFGWLDVVFGTLATLLGAVWAYRFRVYPKRALLGPVLTNALIVPAYLPVVLQGMGFYAIPFTDITLETSYLVMYLFGVVCVGMGQAAVVFCMGMPFASIVRRVLATHAVKG